MSLKSFRYSLDENIRRAARWILDLVTRRSKEDPLDLYKERIEKILLVRANFRMGDLILATPAVAWFRQSFPNARIDFVGAPMSEKLFQNLPIDHHYSISRRYPQSAWDYPFLIKQLRSVGYDLAVELSCSQSAMGSFVVGFSGSRFRVGLKGKWDRWFNVRIPRPAERNKYRILPVYLQEMGLDVSKELASMILSVAEKESGHRKIKDLISWDQAPIVGVFVGARKTRGKRWPIENFCQLITALYGQGVNVVTFLGPEEKNLIGFFRDALDPAIPLVFEPSPRDFAGLVLNCNLLVTCDSGPMHLACALGIRTVAIFQYPNFDHWGPPPTVGRVVYQPGGCSVEGVLGACLAELAHNCSRASDFSREGLFKTSELVSAAPVTKAVRKLELSLSTQRLFFFDRCTQVCFFLGLIIYAWFFPPSGLFEAGTWTEAFTDAFGIGSVLAGVFLRIWALSHAGKRCRSQQHRSSKLLTTGPYAYIRHPIYAGNFLVGLGMLFVSEAFILIPLFVALFALQYRIIVSAEEKFLSEMFGDRFLFYRMMVLKYVPTHLPRIADVSLGSYFSLIELGNTLGILLGARLFEWLESPLRRRLIAKLFLQVLHG